MTVQICGVYWLGDGPPPAERVRAMAEALAVPRSNQVDLATQGRLCVAQTGPAGGPGLYRSGADLVFGPRALVYPAGSDAGTPLVSEDTMLQRSEMHGTEYWRQIDGEYAIGLWQADSERLTLVRDTAGTRPLFYCHQPGEWLAFASAPAALRAGGFASDNADLEVCAMISLGNFAYGERSLFADVRRVLPAHALTVEPAGPRHQRYWSLVCRNPIAPTEDYSAHMKALGETLDAAVRRRLPATGPIASHLSGGLDSSAVAALAARAGAPSDRQVLGYAFAPYPSDLAGMVDELDEVAAVTDAYPNIELTLLRGEGISRIVRDALSPDVPTRIDPDDHHEQLFAHAAEQGARTVLSGFGGDQALSAPGTGAFAEMFLRGRWRSLRRHGAGRARLNRQPLWRVVARDLRDAAFPGWLRALIALRHGRRSATLRRPLEQIIKAEWRRRALRGRFRHRLDSRRNRVDQLTWQHLPFVIEGLSLVAARHGLAYSFPLLDRQLLEHVHRLPTEFFVYDGMNRTAMRDCLAGVLPDRVRLRLNKPMADQGHVVRIAEARADLVALTRDLEASAAAALFDLAEIRAILDDLPDAATMKAEIKRLCVHGAQYTPPNLAQIYALMTARFAGRLINPR